MSCCGTGRSGMKAQCSCASTCRGTGRVLLGAAAIAFMGIAIGGIHSWLRPVSLAVDTTKVQPTILTAPPSAPNSSNTTTPTAPSPPQTNTASNTNPEPVKPAPTAPAPVTLGLEIDSNQAKMLYDMGVPFIDAREANFFAEGHVERALNLTADQVIPAAADLIRWRPGPIVVYCSGGDCDASHHVAQRLQTLQFTQIHIMVDGFQPWKDAGFPVATK